MVVSSPQPVACADCGREAADWHVLTGEGKAMTLCADDLRSFLDAWKAGGLSAASADLAGREVGRDQ